MDGLLSVLDKAASAAGNYFAGQQQAETNQQAAQLELMRQGQVERRANLNAETTQAAFKYVAIGAALLVGVVILSRKKVV